MRRRRRLGRLFGLGFLGGHGFVHPLIGSFQVGLAGVGLVALRLGAFAVQQIHVGHGIIVVGLKPGAPGSRPSCGR